MNAKDYLLLLLQVSIYNQAFYVVVNTTLSCNKRIYSPTDELERRLVCLEHWSEIMLLNLIKILRRHNMQIVNKQLFLKYGDKKKHAYGQLKTLCYILLFY